MMALGKDRVADDQQEDEEYEDCTCGSKYVSSVCQRNHLLRSSGVKSKVDALLC